MDEEETSEQIERRRSIWLRVILYIIKLLIIPVLCLVALGAGLYIGYVYIGDGNASDVTQISTWRHLYDLVFAK